MTGPRGRARRPAGDGGAAFFARHLVVHTHIEKTAGSTVTYALTRMFGAEHCLDLRMPGSPRPDTLPIERRSALRLLAGHFQAGTHEPLFDRPPVRIATLRDPLDRLLSYLGFLARSPGHPEYHRLGTLAPDEAVAAMLAEGHRMVANGQCRVLCGTDRFEDARRAAEADYLAVLPHAEALALAGLFAEALRLPRPNPKIRRNAAPEGPRPRLGDAAAAAVRAATAEDARLVAWAEADAAQRIARARERLAGMAAPP